MFARFRARLRHRRIRRRLARQLGYDRNELAKVDALIRFYDNGEP